MVGVGGGWGGWRKLAEICNAHCNRDLLGESGGVGGGGGGGGGGGAQGCV